MGIALPQFLLNIDGASGGKLLLWIVGVCALLPLVVAVVYISRSSKYTGNYVMHQTLSTYYYFMKPSLKVQPSTLIPKKVGYMYTVLLYAAFASLIHNKHSALEGKRVILFSYGSGLTGTMFLQLRETKNPFNLSNIARVMDVAEKLKSRQEIRSLILDVKVWEPSVINLF